MGRTCQSVTQAQEQKPFFYLDSLLNPPSRQRPQRSLCMSVQSETESPASLSPSAADWMLIGIHAEKEGLVKDN